ncbi:hypothetical protein D3C81_759870 [compost metagenome]
MGGNRQFRAAGAADHTLISQVVNGEQGRGLQAAPVHVGRCQACGPVVGVDQVGLPVNHAFTCRDLGGGQTQAGEANVIVRPVTAVVGTIGSAFALIQFRADQHIDDQAVGQVHAPDLARRQCRMTAQLTDQVNGVFAFQYLRVTGDQHAYIMQMTHCSRQGGGHVAQAAGLDQVGDFRSDEQDFALVRIVPGIGAGCLGCRVEVRAHRRTVVRGEMLYMRFDSGTDHTSLRPYVAGVGTRYCVSAKRLSVCGSNLASMPVNLARKRYAMRRSSRRRGEAKWGV